MVVNGVQGFKLIVMQLLSWLPPECRSLVFALFSIFGIYLICKVLKLIWDVIPVV